MLQLLCFVIREYCCNKISNPNNNEISTHLNKVDALRLVPQTRLFYSLRLIYCTQVSEEMFICLVLRDTDVEISKF